jgi:glycosyltransferase involved in cell wall biosynthesis
VSSPAVSVVVATRDRPQRLAGLLASLRAQTIAEPFEVVVVDDGSDPRTATAIERERGELDLRALRAEGRGPARARNLGWRAARGRWIAFTDDDCEATEGWLEAAIAAAEANPGAIVQGPTVPVPRELDRLGPFARTRSIESPGPWFETCNILYEAELLERLGGFDEAFAEALGEDTDLGWRALELGAGHVWAHEALVHHAVDELGPFGTVRAALRGSDSVLAFRRHPELRSRALRWGVVRNPSLPRLGLALAGLALGRRRPAARLLALPYCRDLAARCRHFGAGPLEAPVYVAADLAAAWTSLRGSVRHRRLVL